MTHPTFSPTFLVSLYSAQTLQQPSCCHIPCNCGHQSSPSSSWTQFWKHFPINMGSTWKLKAQVLIHATYFLPVAISDEVLQSCSSSLILTDLQEKKESCAQLASGQVSKPKLTRTCEHSPSWAVPLAVPNEGSCHRVHFRYIHR